MQNSSRLLMIQPVQFGFNAQTAVNNSFQKMPKGDIQQLALKEFNAFVELLRVNQVEVTVIEDSREPHTPDSIFPNNWISFHADGRVILYPMFAENRRQERKQTVLEPLRKKFIISEIVDLSYWEDEDLYLEGTGSMVLDRENKIAYACLSPRTHEKLLRQFCDLTGYRSFTFEAADATRVPVYHTNVLMCVAKTFAVVCLECIATENEKKKLVIELEQTQKEIIDISMDQLAHFAGNMLQVQNRKGELLLLMSTQAYESLTSLQVNRLLKHNRILHSTLATIEAAGGGSARCMMTEVFLEPR